MNENSTPEPTFEESLHFLLDQVPISIKTFVLNDLGNTTQELMDKFQLHVDQAGVLERELLLTLLGQQEPSQFINELRASGVAENKIQELIPEINSRIFTPLHNKVLSETSTFPVSPIPYATTPAYTSTSTPSVSEFTQKEVSLAPDQTYTPPPVTQSIIPPTPELQPVISESASVSTPKTIESTTSVSAFETPETIPVPIATPIQTPTLTPAATATPQNQSTANHEAFKKVMKDYGVDPYREPFEEK